ncbi:MAG: type II toxin-antitoxin system PemK/MazF family toxin [Oscillospiraceae bacterium]|nr:type II toxin-antitoxin system PemK/MazF family toxin [Oscillospiraceae bacterium]
MSKKKLQQGDIIKTNFDPKLGHEQAGQRPALVVSCKLFNDAVNQMPVLCPITNTTTPFPFHIPLDDRTKTTGVVMCEQMKATDIRERGYIFVEQLPDDLLRRVLNIVRQVFDFDEPEETPTKKAENYE